MNPSPEASSPPSLAVAIEKRRALCDPRGYCGPFTNEAYFARLPEPLWQGTASCIHCGSTVNVGEELDKWERALVRRLLAEPDDGFPARAR